LKKILVTGGAGFLGRRLVAYFLERGDEVHCVDNLTPLTGAIDPERGWPMHEPRDHAGFRFHGEDCRDYFRHAHDTDFDLAFHVAAMVGGREMIESNPLAIADDLSIDAAYWKWAQHTRPGKSVCLSSSAAYPVAYQKRDGYRLLTEDMISFDADIGMPDLMYGWAKLTHEYQARLAYEKHGLRSVTYRPFSGYGEDQDLAYPFPSICRRVIDMAGADSISVWGTGDQMRDFIHIDDCVRGIVTTMDAIEDGSAVNLSTGILTSFKTFASLAARQYGYDPQVTGTSDKPEGVFARGGDTVLQRSLGFTPKVSLEEGIRRALARMRSSGATRPRQ
jgi:nucleoside-diphosphate-sugar epimerase